MGLDSRAAPPPAPTTLPFPSLSRPFFVEAGTAPYLHNYGDVWRFTLYWTLIVYGAVYMGASAYAVAMHRKSWKIAWLIPVVFALIGGLEAVLAGSLVGLMLGSIYRAGSFQMSTWIPLVWALVNVLFLILSSFSMQSGL